MSNKIINFGTRNRKNDKIDQFYADIDMISDQTRYAYVKIDYSSFLAYLISEGKYDVEVGAVTEDSIIDSFWNYIFLDSEDKDEKVHLLYDLKDYDRDTTEIILTEKSVTGFLRQFILVDFNTEELLKIQRMIEDIKSKAKYKIKRDINLRAIYNSLDNIFSWTKGERTLDPEFGSNLYIYLYEGITQDNIEKIVNEIKNCCSKYEPRVKIIKIINTQTIEDTENNRVRFTILFSVPSISNDSYTYDFDYTRNN